MKILHINSYYSTSGLFSNLYNRQVKDNMDIDVYVPISKEFPKDRLASQGDYVMNARVFNQIERFIFPLKHRNILNHLQSSFNFNDYDLIHAHSLFSNGWLARKLSEQYHIPYVVAVRNADIRTFFQKMPWMRPSGLKTLLQAQKIVFISRNSYNEVFEHYIPRKYQDLLRAKTVVLPNGIDDFWHQNMNVNKDYQLHEPLKVVSTGKIMGLKRFIQLSQMVAFYNQHFHPMELHIIGPNWNKKITETLKKSPVVTYHGAKNKEEILELYRQMDIFALLSSPETFGLVYVEAMSQGLPVIYTKGEGFDSFFENYSIGVSVDKDDREGFYRAIDYIRQNYNTLVSQGMQQVSQFNWDDIHSYYKTIYTNILKEDSHEES